MTLSAPAPKIDMRAIGKHFGALVALRQVDFSARRGEIHALLGENGAGKTTLMNVLSGLYRAEAGEIRIDGRPERITTPRQALRRGIAMVHQHVELVPHLSALENILLGREGSRWWLRLEAHRADVQALATRLGLAVDLSLPVQAMGVGDQQKVEILRALYRGAEVLILDEPTAVLTPQEVADLFVTIRRLADQGLTVIFITHKIKEVLAACDRITIMRAGTRVGTLDREAASPDRLVEMMMGERLPAAARPPALESPAPSTPVLSVRDLAVVSADGIRRVAGCSFSLRKGEVVGVAGVAGNGQRELAEALVGLQPVEAGTVELAGRELTHASIRDRMAAGLLYIPEDRLADGLLPSRSVAENLLLGHHPYLFPHRLRLRPGLVRTLARARIQEYGVVPQDERAPGANLSGGNIQKLLVARAITLSEQVRGKLLLAMNPTRGLDVRAEAFIRRRLQEFAGSGGAVLLVSGDLDELLELCDRILVLYRGQFVADVAHRDCDPVRIGHLMLGNRSGAPA